MAGGHVAILLHAHLPFIRHPEHDSFLEESWLFEAITESYVPLLDALGRLVDDGVRFRLTLSLSPTLVAMLRDPLLQGRYLEHMGRLSALAEAEVRRTRTDPRLHPLARHYARWFADTIERFDGRYGRDLAGAFGRLQDEGVLELITTAATHGYLPLLRHQPGAVRAQIATGQESHRAAIGRPAVGMWLPECGYYPGLEDELARAGIRYFVLETHGVLGASPSPRRGIVAPVACPNGLAAFGRDPESSRQVWSAEEGYPGDPVYRDFHRDLGYELPLQDLDGLAPAGAKRVPTGIKYWRITGSGLHREPYDPDAAAARARDHAEHFVTERIRALERHSEVQGDGPPVLTCPYDAELFGHWWLEGPRWLEAVLRGLDRERARAEAITPGDYLDRYGAGQPARPLASSWGEQGYHDYWLSEPNAWVYPHLHDAARRMQSIATAYRDEPCGTPTHRALRQAARCLLLAQASDWTFLMRSGTAVDYAQRRVRDHLARFNYLEAGIRSGRIDPRTLRAIEVLDDVFPDVDYRPYALAADPPSGGAVIPRQADSVPARTLAIPVAPPPPARE
jgi:1,4-alpha-glucan branching enzyme